jgi:hypothetical protein
MSARFYSASNYIPGSNNGTFGMGMSQAVFPKGMGGPFGYRGLPLPIDLEFPASVIPPPYRGNSFGMVYELTPGGSTTSEDWGFSNKAFGRKLRSRGNKKHKKKRVNKKRKNMNKRKLKNN